MGGKEKRIDTTPAQTTQIRNELTKYILDPAQGGLNRMNVAMPQAPSGVTVGGVRDVAMPTGIGGAGMPQINRGQIRDISAGPDVAAERVAAERTQSVDQLGGENSAFFKNMMAQLQPSFQNQRLMAGATAKEMAGTSTGSGFANRLGMAMNRSLGDEQARLADYAAQGIGMETSRQANDANRLLQAAGMNQSSSLQAAVANQAARLQAASANQGADINFLNAMLQQQGLGLQGQELGLRAGMANQNADLQRAMLQAQLAQQANLAGYQGQLGAASQNANNFVQLLGQQGSLGAGPVTVQQSGGWGQLAGMAGGALLGAMAGPMGAQIGGSLGSQIGGWLGGQTGGRYMSPVNDARLNV